MKMIHGRHPHAKGWVRWRRVTLLRPLTRLHLVRQGHGQSGQTREYVLSTVHVLEALGLRDPDLHLLAGKLNGAHESHA